MEVIFLGVGEAFDEKTPNTSMLVRTDIEGKSVSVLLDCGYSVPDKFNHIADSFLSSGKFNHIADSMGKV